MSGKEEWLLTHDLFHSGSGNLGNLAGGDNDPGK